MGYQEKRQQEVKTRIKHLSGSKSQGDVLDNSVYSHN